MLLHERCRFKFPEQKEELLSLLQYMLEHTLSPVQVAVHTEVDVERVQKRLKSSEHIHMM